MIEAEVGLTNVVRVVKVVGLVACGAEFTAQPEVIDGASELLSGVFGPAGRHYRSAVGVSALPRNAPADLEAIFEVRPRVTAG